MEVIVTESYKVRARALGLGLTALLVAGGWPPGAAAQVSFKEDVFPIIELRCLECHQPGGNTKGR